MNFLPHFEFFCCACLIIDLIVDLDLVFRNWIIDSIVDLDLVFRNWIIDSIVDLALVFRNCYGTFVFTL